jgi:UDP-glucose 4-epimerase
VRRILVTGAKGFIGSRVCAELERRGDLPVHFDYPNDVRDSAMLAAFAHVDGVVNLAGVLGTAETIGEEYEAAQVNILGALNVFDAFRSVPIVQIATGHEGQPNPYALTKACITGLALSRAQWMGQKISVVRAYHVYGPGQKMCAPHGTSKVRKIIPSFVARALTDMPIEINGDGLQVVDLVYVDDCAKVLVDALDGPYGKVLEAGTGVRVRVVDCAKDVIVACGGSKSRLVHGPMRRGEPEGAIVVASAALCRNPWPYMLDETIEWYRKKLTLAQAA